MIKAWKHLCTILHHKNLVRAGCFKIGLYKQGLNPYHLHEDEILRILDEDVKVPLSDKIGEALAGPLMVFFYGSGITDAMKPKMEALLHTSFPGASCIAESDMLGAARALLGREQGVAVILGTGSNSCFYDGVNIVRGVPPLGYILGDEGSGTAIGKAFLRLILREPVMAAIKERFFAWAGMGYAGIIDRVYRQPLAACFLGSFFAFSLSSLSCFRIEGLRPGFWGLLLAVALSFLIASARSIREICSPAFTFASSSSTDGVLFICPSIIFAFCSVDCSAAFR